MISLEKLKLLVHTQKLPKTVGDLGKLIVAKGFKNCPKSKKSPYLVTLFTTCFPPPLKFAQRSSAIVMMLSPFKRLQILP